MSELTPEQHYRCLESMYQAAPINDFYKPVMTVSDSYAVIEIEVSDKHHHAAGAMHGSVYFKMLDDAAFFAANSLETDVFVLTTSFTTYLTRPVISGKIRAEGKVVNQNKTQFIAEAVLYDENGNDVGRGNGIFVKSKMSLKTTPGYNQENT